MSILSRPRVEDTMAVSSIHLVKDPMSNMNVPSCIPRAGMNEFAALTLDEPGVIRSCSHVCEQVHDDRISDPFTEVHSDFILENGRSGARFRSVLGL
jgi:hypothetical protein